MTTDNLDPPLDGLLKDAVQFHRDRRFAEARELYLRILNERPEDADLLRFLGIVECQLEYFEDGARHLAQSLDLVPDQADALYNRGSALQCLRRSEEALACYSRAVAVKPDYVTAWFSMGNILLEAQRWEEAVANYDRALKINPNLADVRNNRACALQRLQRYDEALASCNYALRIVPAYAPAHCNQGNILQDLHRFEDAIAGYDRALALEPGMAAALVARGNAMLSLERLEEAFANYRQALDIEPDHPRLFGQVLHIRASLSDWTDFHDDLDQLVTRIRNGEKAVVPFSLLFLKDAPDLQLTTATTYAAEKYPAEQSFATLVKLAPHSRIRLGYFSSDFREHPVSQLVAGLFERHHRESFEVYAFAFGAATQDAWRQRIMAGVDHFIDVSAKTDSEITALVRSLGIDIAVDLNGLTKENRTGIFAQRAAPIQLSHIGYAGTMAAPYFDYLVADSVLIPEDKQRFYSEKIAYVPYYQINDDKRVVAETVFSRSELGLPETGFVFCAFNQNYKVTPDVFDSWMRILAQVSGSVLWLTVKNPTAIANLKAEAQRRGIDADRLIVADKMPRIEDHLARHRAAGLFLDTHPYNAMVTASNALRAGLPLLTRIGQSFASRMGASLLHAVGLPELVTETPEAYEALAVRLATHPDELAAIRQKLADNLPTCALFDTERATRDLEAAYLAMYDRYQAGLKPDHIHI